MKKGVIVLFLIFFIVLNIVSASFFNKDNSNEITGSAVKFNLFTKIIDFVKNLFGIDTVGSSVQPRGFEPTSLEPISITPEEVPFKELAHGEIPTTPSQEIPFNEIAPGEVPEEPSQEEPPEELAPGEVPIILSDCDCIISADCLENYECDLSEECNGVGSIKGLCEEISVTPEEPSQEEPHGEVPIILSDCDCIISADCLENYECDTNSACSTAGGLEGLCEEIPILPTEPDCECASEYPCNEGYECDISSECEHTTNTIGKGTGGICVEQEPSNEAGEENSLYVTCENNVLIGELSRFIGDVNLDNIIDQEDANLISSISDGFTFVSGSDCCVDVNNDDLVNDSDVALVEDFTFTNCFDAGYSCYAMENCVDGIDNDCDTLVDGEDLDCVFSCGAGWLIGDVDGDGYIGIYDSEVVEDISLGLLEIGEICCADVDDDGLVTSEDASLILQYVNGEITSFVAGENCDGVPPENYGGDSGSGSGGGGSGGSAGGNFLAGGELPPCLEAWTCTEWEPESCLQDGMQTRICADLNDCGTQLNKPSESRDCPSAGSEGVADVTDEESVGFSWWIYVIWIIILLTLIGILLKFFILKPKKPISSFPSAVITQPIINIDSKLISFIKDAVSKGYKRGELTNMLKGNGWKDQDINNAFNSILKK